jgi:imidazolonepropionase-like amidohydrolase
MTQPQRTLIQGGHVWNGRDDNRAEQDVLVEGDRIKAVAPRGKIAADGALLVDAAGATLIPGLVEAHGHLSFPMISYTTEIEDTPPEESILITLHTARIMLDAGFTGVIGAGSPRIRTEVVIRNEIDAGRIPGPRLMASTPTLTATGGLNDSGQLHQQRAIAAMVVDGPEEVRKAVRLGYREGVDIVKLNISGDDFFPRPAGRVTTMAEDEVRMACDTAKELGLKVVAHARSAESIKRAVRCGVDIIHHADFCDSEALDMLEAAKDRIFVTPTTGFYHGLLKLSQFPEPLLERMMVRQAFEANVASHTELRKRGLRMLIGGDYGIGFMPNGTNANDIAHLVNYLGFSAVEALRAATYNGGLAMGMGSGEIREGALADLLVVDGDPTMDTALVSDQAKLRVIMKGGALHKHGGAMGGAQNAAAARAA